MLLTYCLTDFEMVPVVPITTGITLVFTFHMRCIFIVRSLYYYYYYYYYYYNCQLLCFWRLALSIVVEVFPRPFFSGYCSFKDVYYTLVTPNCMPYPWVASIFLNFFKVILWLAYRKDIYTYTCACPCLVHIPHLLRFEVLVAFTVKLSSRM
jgi:hypothetical protein